MHTQDTPTVSPTESNPHPQLVRSLLVPLTVALLVVGFLFAPAAVAGSDGTVAVTNHGESDDDMETAPDDEETDDVADDNETAAETGANESDAGNETVAEPNGNETTTGTDGEVTGSEIDDNETATEAEADEGVAETDGNETVAEPDGNETVVETDGNETVVETDANETTAEADESAADDIADNESESDESADGFVVEAVEPAEPTLHINETVELTATITNAADFSTTEVVELALGNSLERDSLSLGSGEQAQLNVSVAGEDLGYGTASYTAATNTDFTRGQVTVVGDEPARFNVSGLEPGDKTLELGDQPLDANATITNTGHVADNQTVQLRIHNDAGANATESGSDVVVNATVELGPRESTSFRVFNLSLDRLDAGNHSYGIYSADDSAMGELNLTAPPTFEISEFAPETTTLEANDTLEVAAIVENTGDRSAERSVNLTIGNATETVTTLDLASGERGNVSVGGINASQLGVGMQEYTLSTGDDTASGEFVVEGEGPAQFEIVDLDPGDTVAENGSLFAEATIENTGAVTANRTVEFRIDNEQWYSTDIELRPGERDDYTLYNVFVGSLAPGEYEYGFFTGADFETATLVIEE